MFRLRLLNWVQYVTLILAVTTAVVVPILFNRVSSIQQHQNDGLRAVICRAEDFIVKDKQLTPAQKKQSLDFYNQSLASIHAAPCLLPNNSLH